MAGEIVGRIPEFTEGGSMEQGAEETTESVETGEEEVLPAQETTTPDDPLPSEETDTTDDVTGGGGSEAPQDSKVIQGLKTERDRLLEEIKALRGSRRELKQDEINIVDKKLDDLQDVSPDDISTIEKVMRAKGYITKDEAQRMSYESVKNDELDKFLAKYPEYKPENDSNDINWSALQREIALYRTPSDPRKVGEILERAHRAITKVAAPDRTLPVRKQAVQTARHGGGGAQPSKVQSTRSSLSAEQKAVYRQGGWTEEEISKMESS